MRLFNLFLYAGKPSEKGDFFCIQILWSPRYTYNETATLFEKHRLARIFCHAQSPILYVTSWKSVITVSRHVTCNSYFPSKSETNNSEHTISDWHRRRFAKGNRKKNIEEEEIELPRNCNCSEKDDSLKYCSSSYSCHIFETMQKKSGGNYVLFLFTYFL